MAGIVGFIVTSWLCLRCLPLDYRLAVPDRASRLDLHPTRAFANPDVRLNQTVLGPTKGTATPLRRVARRAWRASDSGSEGMANFDLSSFFEEGEEGEAGHKSHAISAWAKPERALPEGNIPTVPLGLKHHTVCRTIIVSRGPLGGSVFGFCLAAKGAASPSLPEHRHLFAVLTLESERKFKESTVEHSSVIFGEFDKTGFDHEPAKLNQMPGAFASLHDPIPPIKSGKLRFKPMPGRCCPE